MKTPEEKKREFLDLKLQIYALINEGKVQEAQNLYNRYFLLHKDLMNISLPKDAMRWNADITRVYNKLREAMDQTSQSQSADNEKPKHQYIETEFDLLLKMIEQKGKVRLHEIEERFSISSKLAEEWIQILADHDLVDIFYLPVGGIEVTLFNPKRKRRGALPLEK